MKKIVLFLTLSLFALSTSAFATTVGVRRTAQSIADEAVSIFKTTPRGSRGRLTTKYSFVNLPYKPTFQGAAVHASRGTLDHTPFKKAVKSIPNDRFREVYPIFREKIKTEQHIILPPMGEIYALLPAQLIPFAGPLLVEVGEVGRRGVKGIRNMSRPTMIEHRITYGQQPEVRIFLPKKAETGDNFKVTGLSTKQNKKYSQLLRTEVERLGLTKNLEISANEQTYYIKVPYFTEVSARTGGEFDVTGLTAAENQRVTKLIKDTLHPPEALVEIQHTPRSAASRSTDVTTSAAAKHELVETHYPASSAPARTTKWHRLNIISESKKSGWGSKQKKQESKLLEIELPIGAEIDSQTLKVTGLSDDLNAQWTDKLRAKVLEARK